MIEKHTHINQIHKIPKIHHIVRSQKRSEKDRKEREERKIYIYIYVNEYTMTKHTVLLHNTKINTIQYRNLKSKFHCTLIENLET